MANKKPYVRDDTGNFITEIASEDVVDISTLPVASQSDVDNGSSLKLTTAAALKTVIDLVTNVSQSIASTVHYVLSSRHVILYPDGTEESPPITVNNTFKSVPNPFPGHTVVCVAEVFWGGQWGDPNWQAAYQNKWQSYGIIAKQVDKGDIIVRFGANGIGFAANITGSALSFTTVVSNLPFRIKVWMAD